jgi:uncharacterized membrane protein YeaQ/YmgE (transglycosylase-associated protein family)
MAIILLASLVLGVLGGWLVPIIFKSERPYGLVGDILVCASVSVILSFLSWNYLMPALGFEDGWIKVLGSTGDPVFFGLICLWVMRKIKG